MTPPRHRLLALTSAAVLSLSVLGPTGAAAEGPASTAAYDAAAADRTLEPLVATRPGLARLTSAGPSASGPERAIVTFEMPSVGSVAPSAGEVAARQADERDRHARARTLTLQRSEDFRPPGVVRGED